MLNPTDPQLLANVKFPDADILHVANMLPEHEQQRLREQFKKPGQDRGKGRSLDSQSGKAKMTEYQDIIKNHIDGHAHKAGCNGPKYLSQYLQRTAVADGHNKG